MRGWSAKVASEPNTSYPDTSNVHAVFNRIRPMLRTIFVLAGIIFFIGFARKTSPFRAGM